MGSPLYPHEERQSEDKKVGMVGPGTGENREGEKRRSHNEFLPLSLLPPPFFPVMGIMGKEEKRTFCPSHMCWSGKGKIHTRKREESGLSLGPICCARAGG